MRFQEAPILDQFDPESDGYDYQSAIDSGDKPDEQTKHWSSLDPRTGMVLKGRNHPTWDMMVDEETKLGNSVIKADDGRYYSVKLPRYMSEAKPILEETGFEDTTLNVAERAKRDYDFAMENNLTLGFFGSLKREWTGKQALKKVPFAGGVIGGVENLATIAAANRLKSNYDYSKPIVSQQENIFIGQMQGLPAGLPQSMTYATKEGDKKLIADYFKYISTDQTVMGKIASGVSALPTWITEFAMTGGLASLGDEAAVKAGEKILGSYAQTTAGKLALKAAGWSGGAVARSAGLGHQVFDKMSKRQLDVILGLQEDENWAMSALIAWGDTVIESASESAGEGLTKAGGFALGKLPFGSKLTSALEKTWITVTGGTKGEFARKLLSKGGYSNILGEIGEERLGTILRAITEVDDFGLGKDASMIDRLKAGLLQDIENIGVEVGVLSVPMGGQFALSKISNLGRVKPDFDSTQFDQTVEPAPSAEVIKEITTPVDTKPEKATQIAPVEEKVVTPTQTTPETEIVKETPITIETANTSKEVEEITNQIITQGIDPTKTSARQADLQEDRAALGLGGIASAERKSWQKSLQQAKDQNVINESLRIAAEVNSKPRALTDVETAGLVMKAAQLKKEHKTLTAQMESLTDKSDIDSLSAKIDVVEKEFDTITNALYQSGTEKGRNLVSQKLTINQDFDLLSLKNRAKKIKGRELTEKENAKIEQLSKDLELQKQLNEAQQKRIGELMAKNFVREGSIRRFSKMKRVDIDAELDGLISRTKQLLDEGCLN